MDLTEKNTTGKSRQYKIRQSYAYQAKHVNDVYLNMGYDYKGNILKNGTSSELWANPQQTSLIKRIEGMIVFLIEQAKNIKKHFSIAHDADTTLIN